MWRCWPRAQRRGLTPALIVALAVLRGVLGETCWPRRCIAEAQLPPGFLSSLLQAEPRSGRRASRPPHLPYCRPGRRTVPSRDIAGPGPQLLVQLDVLGANDTSYQSSQCPRHRHWHFVSLFPGLPGADTDVTSYHVWPQRHYLPPGNRR